MIEWNLKIYKIFYLFIDTEENLTEKEYNEILASLVAASPILNPNSVGPGNFINYQ
jgi:hypothetical protein